MVQSHAYFYRFAKSGAFLQFQTITTHYLEKGLGCNNEFLDFLFA